MLARLATVGFGCAVLLAPRLAAQKGGSAEERAAVHQAALDYLDAFYQGDSTKLVRSVRPDFYKIGFWRPKDAATYNPPEQMSWSEALAFVRGVRERQNFPPSTAPKVVEVLDVLDQTAAAKVTAWWGTDYLLLGKYGGKWMTSHILWQSPPPASRN
jgi:hypothetical protein